MKLIPKKQERLTAFIAAEIARCRKERDVPLNHPEVVAYITDRRTECGWDGQFVAEIRSGASQLLGRENVMGGVLEMIDMIQVEPMFPDGTKFVTVHDPIRLDSVGIADSTMNAATDRGDTDDTDTSGGDDV